jgi:hypothetical protein
MSDKTKERIGATLAGIVGLALYYLWHFVLTGRVFMP